MLSNALGIEDQFNFIGIRINPNIFFLALIASPIPMRKDVNNSLISPPRLVIVVNILWETARVHDPEVTVDRWPSGWSRFASIVEAGPYEATHEPFASGGIRPPLLGTGAPANFLSIVSGDSTVLKVIYVRAARCRRTGGFTTVDWLERMIFVILVSCAKTVIKTSNINSCINSVILTAIIAGVGRESSRI